MGGHYAIARTHGDKIAIMANYHNSGLDNRTNVYYLESLDWGDTWQRIDGTPVSSPITSVSDSARAVDYIAQTELVYLKSMDFDAAGNPVMLYLTVSDAGGSGHQAGPQGGGDGRRTLKTTRWDGTAWVTRDVVTTDHNYDHGELHIAADGTWQVIGAFIDGPQAWGTGGQIGIWSSDDQGLTWSLLRQITHDTEHNRTYPRLVHQADDDFFALWADGNATSGSDSQLYFTNRDGTAVYAMPTDIYGDTARPTLVWSVTAGDTDGDGLIDTTDLAALAGHWGQGGAGWNGGDFNNDGIVDARDLDALRLNWSGTPSAFAQAVSATNFVPEPSSLGLLGLGLLLVAVRGRR